MNSGPLSDRMWPGNGTLTLTGATLFANTTNFKLASFAANGTGAAVTLGATAPAAITTPGSFFIWLTVQDRPENTTYVPSWH